MSKVSEQGQQGQGEKERISNADRAIIEYLCGPADGHEFPSERAKRLGIIRGIVQRPEGLVKLLATVEAYDPSVSGGTPNESSVTSEGGGE